MPTLGSVTSATDPDGAWQRPGPTPLQRRRDVALALAFTALASVTLELGRSMGWLRELHDPVWLQHLGILTGTAALAVRRRYPLSAGGYGAVHMFVVGTMLGPVIALWPMQLAYFLLMYSAVAWARNRQVMVILTVAVLLLMFGWLAFYLAVGSGVEDLVARGEQTVRPGLLTPAVAAGLYSVLLNAVFFGGAILLGRNAFRAARQEAVVVEQAATIAAQAARLSEQAVVAERLRIARELHDVVAHHVSAMGVQAAGARRVLRSDPDRAETALLAVETAGRDAVGQMRTLVGALRTGDGVTAPATPGAVADDRAPQPGLADLPALVAASREAGLQVDLRVLDGPAPQVPARVALALYRVVQEALSNVRRHSTAGRARVTVRLAEGWAEAEVLDDGRPKGPWTGGSGLGLLGMRERVALLGGTAEIGPRVVGGYRVRVRFPVAGDAASGGSPR